MPPVFDVAVVGAGVIGCLTALEIAERAPDLSVVLLDRDMAGGGASRRSAGLHVPRGTTERVRRMTRHSQDFYAKLKANSPTLPIHPLPVIVVAAEQSAATLHEVYLPEAALTPAPDGPGQGVELPDGMAAWHLTGCQYADVYALTQLLARRLRERVVVREGVAVTALEVTGDGVTLRLGTGEALPARRVVLAPGPWIGAGAWAELVVPLGMRVKKVVALHIEQPPPPGAHAIVFQDVDAFLLPLAERGCWLYSYTCQEWDVDPDALRSGLSANDIAEATEVLRHRAPGYADRLSSGRVFCDAFSGTGQPRIQALDDAGRVVFAGAANGSGYRLAPAIAADAVDLLLTGRNQS
jgi:glycine/D-amino acid oxidase-like deaminating enzyme